MSLAGILWAHSDLTSNGFESFEYWCNVIHWLKFRFRITKKQKNETILFTSTESAISLPSKISRCLMPFFDALFSPLYRFKLQLRCNICTKSLQVSAICPWIKFKWNWTSSSVVWFYLLLFNWIVWRCSTVWLEHVHRIVFASIWKMLIMKIHLIRPCVV